MLFEDGAVALVTGGSGGIGRAAAADLAREGAHVVVSYRSGEVAAKEVVATIEDLGGSAEAVQVDVTDEKQVADAVRRIRTDHGRLDVLVTSAGTTDDQHFVAMSSRRFTDLMNVNVTGTFLACREAMRVMQHQRSGAIVTVSSSSGLDGGFPGQANYVASKGAIISFTKAIAYEAARYGVRANVVAPGFVSTEMTQRLPAHIRTQYAQRIRMGRMGRPEEIGALISFLASDRSSYVTGSVLVANGGGFG